MYTGGATTTGGGGGGGATYTGGAAYTGTPTDTATPGTATDTHGAPTHTGGASCSDSPNETPATAFSTAQPLTHPKIMLFFITSLPFRQAPQRGFGRLDATSTSFSHRKNTPCD